MPTQSFLDRLHEFIDWSSCRPMEGEDDLASYYEHFLSLSEPPLFFREVSRGECNRLFWQGLHPDDRSMLSPYLIKKRPNHSPGANFDFRELFHLAYTVLTRRRFAAEDEAARRRKLAREEEDRELEYLITNMHGLSVHDHAYAALYRRCACRFPDVAEELAKPEPSSKPARDTPLRQTSHSYHTPALTISVEPSPLPPRLLSPLAAQSPRTPDMKPDTCPVEERRNTAEIKSVNVSTADEPTQPQLPGVLRQRRLRRHRQNRLRHPSHSLPAYLRTMSQVRRPCYRSLKSLALSAFAPLAFAQDTSKSVVPSPLLPLPPLAAPSHRTPEVKTDSRPARPAEERRNATEIKSVNISTVEEPTQPQSLALSASASAPFALTQDVSESVVPSPPLPLSPLAASSHRMPEVKTDNRPVEERRNATEIKSVNVSTVEEPTQPQSLAQSASASASAPLALAQDVSESVVPSPPLPLPPLAAPSHRTPEVKTDNRPAEERCNPSGPQRSNPSTLRQQDSQHSGNHNSQRVLHQRRLRRQQQKDPRHPYQSLPALSRTIAYICRPRRRSFKISALFASVPPAPTPDNAEQILTPPWPPDPPLSLSPLSAPRHHLPEVKFYSCHIQERLEVPEIKSSNNVSAEKSKQPQVGRCQKRFRRRQQNYPLTASHSLPVRSRSIAHVCLWHLKWRRPRRRGHKTAALTASVPFVTPSAHSVELSTSSPAIPSLSSTLTSESASSQVTSPASPSHECTPVSLRNLSTLPQPPSSSPTSKLALPPPPFSTSSHHSPNNVPNIFDNNSSNTNAVRNSSRRSSDATLPASAFPSSTTTHNEPVPERTNIYTTTQPVEIESAHHASPDLKPPVGALTVSVPTPVLPDIFNNDSNNTVPSAATCDDKHDCVHILIAPTIITQVMQDRPNVPSCRTAI